MKVRKRNNKFYELRLSHGKKALEPKINDKFFTKKKNHIMALSKQILTLRVSNVTNLKESIQKCNEYYYVLL